MENTCHRRNPIARLLDAPEFNVAIFSFLLNFVWEFLQVPTYAGMAEVAHWQGIKICTFATIGDVAFALASFWLAAWFAHSRQWMRKPNKAALTVFLSSGLIITMAIEFYYTEIAYRWSYAPSMPRLPLLGTGLSAMLQWLVVPLLVVWFVRRQLDHLDKRAGTVS